MRALFWFMLFMCKNIFATEDGDDDPEDVSNRILGGTIASPGEFPFVVGLLIEFKTGQFMRCTGTVLDQYSVLTAGHCILGYKTITIYVNCTNVVQCSNTRTGRGFLHPKYQEAENFTLNDVGVVNTTEAIDTEEVIELAKPNPPYRTCTVVGYGKPARNGSTTTERFLYKVDMTLIVWCHTIFPGSKWFEKQLCSYVKSGRQPYFGDSGGPLLCNKKQIGITSIEVAPSKRTKGQTVIRWSIPKYGTTWVEEAMLGSAVLQLVSLLLMTLCCFTVKMIT